ncbi:MAG TPA: bifunctional glycosyltransferase/class I SAM-dependent methyltransferase, partial [Actinomycetota bacterium]
MPKTVITMPAFRAGQTLAKTVADIPEGVADQLILVDDASPDNTVELARSLGIKVYVHPRNRGYGGNQKTCYTMALEEDAEVVVMLHPDYQYEPKAVPLLIAPILAGDADMTFGSRFAGLSDPRAGGMPLYRYIGNRVTTMLQNWMLGSRFTEMHSGMRAYTRDCLLSMPFLRYSDDFLFDEQFMVDAVTSGQRVVEVPIPTRYTKESSSISVIRSIKYVARGVAYCARQSAARGRRGRKWPVTAREPAPAPSLGGGKKLARDCVLCGGSAHTQVEDASLPYPTLAQCDSCGLVASLREEGAPEVVKDYPPIVDETFLARETARREAFDWIARQMSGFVVEGRRLVEAGTRAGLFLDVARRWGWDGRGVDAPAWSIEMARERFGVDVQDVTLQELKEDPHSIDAVAFLDVLDRIDDPRAAVERAHELLGERGILVVLSSLLPADGKPHAAMGARRHYFSTQTLQALLMRSDYRVVDWSLVPRAMRPEEPPATGPSQPGDRAAGITADS